MNFVRIFMACVVVVFSLRSAHALNIRTEASAAWAENIARASAPADWQDAMRYEARTTVGLFREWRAGFMTSGELGAGYEHVPEFSKLDALSGGLAATVRQKFGFGAFAPALALDLGLRRREAKLNED